MQKGQWCLRGTTQRKAAVKSCGSRWSITANWTSDLKDSRCFSKASEHLRLSAAQCLSFTGDGNGPELLSKVLLGG